MPLKKVRLEAIKGSDGQEHTIDAYVRNQEFLDQGIVDFLNKPKLAGIGLNAMQTDAILHEVYGKSFLPVFKGSDLECDYNQSFMVLPMIETTSEDWSYTQFLYSLAPVFESRTALPPYTLQLPFSTGEGGNRHAMLLDINVAANGDISVKLINPLGPNSSYNECYDKILTQVQLAINYGNWKNSGKTNNVKLSLQDKNITIDKSQDQKDGISCGLHLLRNINKNAKKVAGLENKMSDKLGQEVFKGLEKEPHDPEKVLKSMQTRLRSPENAKKLQQRPGTPALDQDWQGSTIDKNSKFDLEATIKKYSTSTFTITPQEIADILKGIDGQNDKGASADKENKDDTKAGGAGLDVDAGENDKYRKPPAESTVKGCREAIIAQAKAVGLITSAPDTHDGKTTIVLTDKDKPESKSTITIDNKTNVLNFKLDANTTDKADINKHLEAVVAGLIKAGRPDKEHPITLSAGGTQQQRDDIGVALFLAFEKQGKSLDPAFVKKTAGDGLEVQYMKTSALKELETAAQENTGTHNTDDAANVRIGTGTINKNSG